MENNEMQAFLDLMLHRRSVRAYTDEPINKEQIKALLLAGFNAPSAKALYPCHFVVVQDEKVKQEIISFHATAKFLAEAPLGVVVCGDVTRAWATWRDDCAAATMSMIYAGEAMGLSSCWCAIYPRDVRVDGMKKALTLPGHIMPYSLVVFGHGTAPKKRRDRFDEACIHPDSRW